MIAACVLLHVSFLSFPALSTTSPGGFYFILWEVGGGRGWWSEKEEAGPGLIHARRTITFGIKKGICEMAFLSSFLPSSLYISTTNLHIKSSRNEILIFKSITAFHKNRFISIYICKNIVTDMGLFKPEKFTLLLKRSLSV